MFGALVTATLSTQVMAASQTELGISYSSIEYVEPGVMREEGNLFGFQGRFTNYGSTFVALEVDYAFGDMDYEGSGTLQDIPNNLFEMRALFGPRLYQSTRSQLHAYAGIGQRYLSDDSSGMKTSIVPGTGKPSSGYTREQYYWYIPVGLNWRRSLASGWEVALRAEYDYFIAGRNYSGIDEVCGGGSGVFTQEDGKGYRFALKFTMPVSDGGGSLAIEPYYRYWDIEDSDTDYISTPRCTGPGYGYYYEPQNTSEEAGIGIRWVF